MQKPGNLSIVVLDNERYGETGGQTSHTSAVADLVGVAKACGIADSQAITTLADVEGLVPKLHELKSGPRFANIQDRRRQCGSDPAECGTAPSL